MTLDDDLVSKIIKEDKYAPYDSRRVVSHEEVEQSCPPPRWPAAREGLRYLAGQRRGGSSKLTPTYT